MYPIEQIVIEPIQAVEAITCNPRITLIKTAPLLSQTFLRGILAATVSKQEAKIEDVIEHCFIICHLEGIKKPNYNEFLTSANWLETVGLIITDNLKHGIHSKGRFKDDSI